MEKFSKTAVLTLAAALLAALLTVFPSAAKTPVISLNPQSVNWPDNAPAAVYSCRCSNENTEYGTEFSREWYFFYNGMDFPAGYVIEEPSKFPFGDFDKEGSGFVGTTIMLANPGKGLDGVEIYCVVKSDETHFAESTRATILVSDPAYTPAPPEFTSVPSEISATAGKPFTIECSYLQNAQGAHTPIWYETPNGKLEEIKAILDAPAKNSITLTENKPGDYYYVLGVEVQTADGMNASISYSSPIHVTVTKQGEEQPEQGAGLEIIDMPKKTSYFLGDAVSLKGLRVRYYTDMGFADVVDGKGMGVSPTTLTKYGNNRITLIYEGQTVSFDVFVEGAPAIPHSDSVTFPEGAVKTGTPVTLSVTAHSTDGGSLTYQWYSTTVNDISTIMAIFPDETVTDVTGPFLTVPQTEGTVYYAVAVWTTRASGLSQPVYSDLIPVTYEKDSPVTGDQSGSQPGTGKQPDGTNEAPSTKSPENGKDSAEPTVPLRTVIIVGLGVLASILVIVVAAVLIGRVNAKEKMNGR